MGSDGPCAHFSANHWGREDGVFGPTRASSSPWAAEGCGPQDPECQAVSPLGLQSHTCSPPQAPRLNLDAGSVSPPRALADHSFEAQGIPSPHSWVPSAHSVRAPEQGLRNFLPD